MGDEKESSHLCLSSSFLRGCLVKEIKKRTTPFTWQINSANRYRYQFSLRGWLRSSMVNKGRWWPRSGNISLYCLYCLYSASSLPFQIHDPKRMRVRCFRWPNTMSSRLAYTTIYIYYYCGSKCVIIGKKIASLPEKNDLCVGCGMGKSGAEMLATFLTIFSFLSFSLLNILSLFSNSLLISSFSHFYSFLQSVSCPFVCLSVHSIAFSSMIFILFPFFFLSRSVVSVKYIQREVLFRC